MATNPATASDSIALLIDADNGWKSNHGFAKLGDLFTAIDLFETRKTQLPTGGTYIQVRLCG